MLKSYSLKTTIGFIAILLFPLSLFSQNKERYANLQEAIFSTAKLRGNSGPRSVNWINGGNQYSYTIYDPNQRQEEIHVFDPASLKDQLLLDNNSLKFPGTDSAFRYQSFQWSQDSRHLVFQSNFRKIYRRSGISDYYIYSLTDKNLQPVARDARTAELSPDGSMVGIERGGNMFVYNFSSGKETQLTNDATGEDQIFNGHYDWVYEEEFGQAQAWNWSPDSKYIAYWQFDESGVPIFSMTNYEGIHPEEVKIPIPQPGDPNPKVRIGVIDVKNNKKIWLSPDETGDFYIPRIYWTSDPDVLAMMILNRAQNNMKLYFFNVKTGEHHVVLQEKNNTWVAIFNFYTDVNDMIYFPEKSKEFFWVSDRSGYYHIYRYNYSGKLLNQVTKGNWDVIKVSGIDPAAKKIYYLSAEASPLEQQLYSIGFNGENKSKLTTVPGYHVINMSPNTKYYLDTYSNVNTPVHVSLNNNGGKELKMLVDNHEVSDYLNTHAYATTEFIQVKTSDSIILDASIMKPLDFDAAKKYPVVFTVYGGPESHEVYNRFETSGWKQWLAQNGYIVVDVNNRGSANYGSAFMKSVYKQLGKWESNDYVETARYLSKLPYVDSSRMAIMGTSYGGYITTYTLLTHPGVFKVGIANSPVTDWRLYDDIYTERYMSLLQDNEAGYINSADATHAGALQDHLLLIHSMSDDNVHPANTMQLLTALTNAGKDAELRIYPPGAHGAAYNLQSQLLIYKVYYQFLQRYLNAGADTEK